MISSPSESSLGEIPQEEQNVLLQDSVGTCVSSIHDTESINHATPFQDGKIARFRELQTVARNAIETISVSCLTNLFAKASHEEDEVEPMSHEVNFSHDTPAGFAAYEQYRSQFDGTEDVEVSEVQLASSPRSFCENTILESFSGQNTTNENRSIFSLSTSPFLDGVFNLYTSSLYQKSPSATSSSCPLAPLHVSPTSFYVPELDFSVISQRIELALASEVDYTFSYISTATCWRGMVVATGHGHREVVISVYWDPASASHLVELRRLMGDAMNPTRWCLFSRIREAVLESSLEEGIDAYMLSKLAPHSKELLKSSPESFYDPSVVDEAAVECAKTCARSSARWDDIAANIPPALPGAEETLASGLRRGGMSKALPFPLECSEVDKKAVVADGEDCALRSSLRMILAMCNGGDGEALQASQLLCSIVNDHKAALLSLLCSSESSDAEPNSPSLTESDNSPTASSSPSFFSSKGCVMISIFDALLQRDCTATVSFTLLSLASLVEFAEPFRMYFAESSNLLPAVVQIVLQNVSSERTYRYAFLRRKAAESLATIGAKSKEKVCEAFEHLGVHGISDWDNLLAGISDGLTRRYVAQMRDYLFSKCDGFGDFASCF